MGINQLRNVKYDALSDLTDVTGYSDGQTLIYSSGTNTWSGETVGSTTDISGLSGRIDTLSGYASGLSGYISGVSGYASGISGLASGTDRRTAGISGSTLIYPANTTALDWANRQLIAENGLTPMLNWVNSGYVNFFSNQISTSGLVSGGGFQLNITNPAAPAIGRFTWNDTDGTVDLMLKSGNVTLQLGQEMLIRVVNKTGADFTDGQLVYISGSQGNRPTAALAIANDESKSCVCGMVTEPIANNQEGFIATAGYIRGLNTSGYTEGDILWLSPTASGEYTSTKPEAPNFQCKVGIITNAHLTQGSIYLLPEISVGINTLHDVDGTLLTTSGQILVYNPTSGYWDANYNINNYTLLSDYSGLSGSVAGISGYALYDSGGTGAIYWQSRTAFDSFENASIDWANRYLYDASGNLALDWDIRTLYTSNGVTQALDYTNSGEVYFYFNNILTSGRIIGSNITDNIGIQINSESLIVSGTKGYKIIDYSGNIESFTLLSKINSGYIKFDIKKCQLVDFPITSSIVSTDYPTLSGGLYYSENTVSGWAVVPGDVIEFYVVDASGIKDINLQLGIKK